MISTPEIVTVAAQPVAQIHLTIPRSEIRQVMGPAIQEVMSAVALQGVGPAGPWLSHHLRMAPEVFDFEVAVPVHGTVTSAGRVKPGTLPAATVARTVYTGPYEGLGAAWGEFRAWITAAGHSPAPNLWERYLVGPESGGDGPGYQTELNQPLLV